MRHFVYVCSKRNKRRYVGGENYTLQVFEFKAKGKLEFVGETSRCTSAHRGYIAEAWGVVVNKFPRLAKKLEATGCPKGYYTYTQGEEAGIILQDLGGA
jgi:hypothetical protein